MRDATLGPLGRRLFAAFVLVAMSSIVVLSAAALVGTSQGLHAQDQAKRQATTDAIARMLGSAYDKAGTWSGMDLSGAGNLADASGVRFVVRDAAGSPVGAWSRGAGMPMGSGMGLGMMAGAGNGPGRWVSADVRSASTRAIVGVVSVGFTTALAGNAQTIAWTWIAIAAVASLLVAFIVAWFVTRRISEPLMRISGTARRFAAGDRSARTDRRDASSRWELGDMARAFDETADDVVRSETARRRIAADVAHELRTPLTVLQAGLEEMRDGYVPADADHVQVLHSQALRLGRIVDDLAALAAAETAALSLHPAPADLSEIARDALRDVGSRLQAAGIVAELHSAAPVPVLVDADRMHQALTNLLTNAARYCRAGDRVAVAVESDATSALLTVADTGPGVPEDELAHLFDRLWRGSNARDSAGSGIGLAVTRELVEAQRGTIAVLRNDAGGLTFTLRLPLHRQ